MIRSFIILRGFMVYHGEFSSGVSHQTRFRASWGSKRVFLHTYILSIRMLFLPLASLSICFSASLTSCGSLASRPRPLKIILCATTAEVAGRGLYGSWASVTCLALGLDTLVADASERVLMLGCLTFKAWAAVEDNSNIFQEMDKRQLIYYDSSRTFRVSLPVDCYKIIYVLPYANLDWVKSLSLETNLPGRGLPPYNL